MTTPKRKTAAAPRAPQQAAGTPKSGAVRIDLDAAAAARREELGAPEIEVTFRGRPYRLPVELPLEAVEPLAELGEMEDLTEEQAAGPDGVKQLRLVKTRFESGLAMLFCNEMPRPEPADDGTVTHGSGCQWAEFKRSAPSLEDLTALWNGLFAAYGTTMGEALASWRSAASDGAPSKRTSSGGTGSTRGRSGAGRARKGR